MPHLTRIVVYPIKSFDGVELTSSEFVPAGGLRHDRRFALVDRSGDYVNGKRYPSIHRLRVTFSPDFAAVTLAPPDARPATFRLAAGDAEFEAFCSRYFGLPVRLTENLEAGFPDDDASPGPTIVGTPSLRCVAAWFPPLDLDEIRRRFRANLEIDAAPPDAAAAADDDCPPFWEDRLFAADASPETRTVVPFRIGPVGLHGVNPCARCVVPTRDSHTGAVFARFAQQFQQQRRASLPPWAAATAFDHFYRLTVNTRPDPAAAAGGVIRLGDVVTID